MMLAAFFGDGGESFIHSKEERQNRCRVAPTRAGARDGRTGSRWEEITKEEEEEEEITRS